MLTNFNLSIAVPDRFMEAREADGEFELVHAVPPGERLVRERSIERRRDGLYVYKRVRARELWERAMRATYDHAGGKEARPPQDYGFMHVRTFLDLDGHHWEVLHMDAARTSRDVTPMA